MTLLKELDTLIDSLEHVIVDHAVNLIRFPTTSKNEAGAQQYVKEVMTGLGCTTVDLWEPDINLLKSHEAFVSSRSDFKGSPNVVGTWKGTGGGKSLIINSHIDIVPEGSVDEWQYSPFGGDVDKGVIYGRGASDMKASKAAVFGAIQALSQAGVQLKGDLIVQSVIEEETGSAGSLACALKGYKADAAIVPEPTGFNICPAQQGSSWFRIDIRGKSAHAGQRYLGVSAIDKAIVVIDALHEFETFLNQTYTSSLYTGVPIPFSLNIGTIRGGDWASTVPEKVTIEGRLGVPPGLSLKKAWQLLEDRVQQKVSQDPWLARNRPVIEWFGAWWGPAEIDPDHPIVTSVRTACENTLSFSPDIKGTPWGTDARILTEFADTPALVFGPGTSAHCPDEFIPIKDLVMFAKILAAVIVDWCGN
ncbi:MAG: peptidase [Desulfotignum sp.]|nr:peptidase [Desulfotignum sp.]MCF8126290.1 peptidase [Desulfotignum sp.]